MRDFNYNEYVFIPHELMNEVIKSKPSHFSLGAKAITLIVAGKLFLNLTSCTAPRELDVVPVNKDSTQSKNVEFSEADSVKNQLKKFIGKPSVDQDKWDTIWITSDKYILGNRKGIVRKCINIKGNDSINGNPEPKK